MTSGKQVVASLLTGCALIVATLFVASCDSGGGGGPDGGATIQGTVSSFSSGAAIFVPSPRKSLLAVLVDTIVPDARAAVAGVSVRVRGTDLVARSEDDGFFIISGVPGGQQVLDFSLGADTGSLSINVPDDSVITLNNVRVSGSNASAGNVQVVASANNNANGNSNANRNDNDDDDDNRNGNANSNDNDDDDDDDNRNGNSNANSNSNSNDNDDDDDNDND